LTDKIHKFPLLVLARNKLDNDYPVIVVSVFRMIHINYDCLTFHTARNFFVPRFA